MIKTLISGLAIVSICIIGSPSSAGLGDAAKKSTESGYEAWCGEEGNSCNVRFTDGKITVNNSDSVNFNDITYITRNVEHKKTIFKSKSIHTFGIEYLEAGMKQPEFAEILFINNGAADMFWRDLQRACRKCKDRDATQVEVNIKD